MSFWLASFIVYIAVAIAWSVFVPFRVGRVHDKHELPDMCPECKLAPAPAWVRVIAGFFWPIIAIVTVALLMVQLATGGRR